MNKTLLIFKHEFLHTIKRTGFIIIVLALPVLSLLGIGIYHIVSGITRPPTEAARIGYVDEAGGFEEFTNQWKTTLVSFDTVEAAKQALTKEDITEYFVIPPDFIATGIISRYTKQRELTPSDTTYAAVKNFISRNLLAEKVPTATINRVVAPLNMVTTTLTSTGTVATEQGGFSSLIIPGIFGVMLSSVSTRQLLTGKVLGLGAAGMVQVVVWVVSIPLLLNLASSSIGGFLSTIQITPSLFVLGVVYFILGYSLFAVLSAAVAAMSSTVREAQSLGSIYTLFAIAPFWFLSLLMFFPNSPIWIVFSIFPFSAPVLVMLRLGLTGVPIWQLAVSITVLVLSIIGGLLLAAKLLRTYILMYGKRPGIREIIRNLRAR